MRPAQDEADDVGLDLKQADPSQIGRASRSAITPSCSAPSADSPQEGGESAEPEDAPSKPELFDDSEEWDYDPFIDPDADPEPDDEPVDLPPSIQPRRHVAPAIPPPETSSLGQRLTRALLVLAVILLVPALFKAFVVQTYEIPSGSMERTLRDGDKVAVTMFDSDRIDRGDVVVFTDPDDWLHVEEPTGLRGAIQKVMVSVSLLPEHTGHHLVKRVIGVGGDHVVASHTDHPFNEVVTGVLGQEAHGDHDLLDGATQSRRLLDMEPVVGVGEDDDVAPVDAVGVEHRDRNLIPVTQGAFHGPRGDLVGLDDEGLEQGGDQENDCQDEQRPRQPLPQGAGLRRRDGGGHVPTRLDRGRQIHGLVVGFGVGIGIDERVVVPLLAVIEQFRLRGRVLRFRRLTALLGRVCGRGAAGRGDGGPGGPADLRGIGLFQVQSDVVGLILRRSHRAPSLSVDVRDVRYSPPYGGQR